MPTKRTKGSAFERQIATHLSKWWSGGTRDDLVWRTAGSGGRATNRGKKGKTTVNACGDLCATDADIQPLFNLFTFELKVGYPATSITDLIDRPESRAFAKDRWDGWYHQANESAKSAGTPLWLLIHRSPSRETMVYVSDGPDLALRERTNFAFWAARTSVCVNGQVRDKDGDYRAVSICGARFGDMFPLYPKFDVEKPDDAFLSFLTRENVEHDAAKSFPKLSTT